ncbi:hypothetical protein ACQYE5_002932 [Enterobacter cancerogenus]
MVQSKSILLVENYADYFKQAFNNNVLPYIDSKPVNKIKLLEPFSVLQQMEKWELPEFASKVRQRCSEIFRCAIVEYNPTAVLGSALKAIINSITPSLPQLSCLSFCKSYQATLEVLLLFWQPVYSC